MVELESLDEYGTRSRARRAVRSSGRKQGQAPVCWPLATETEHAEPELSGDQAIDKKDGRHQVGKDQTRSTGRPGYR